MIMCPLYTATLVSRLLAWLVQNMSTHGGEETWLTTLKKVYTKPDNIRNMIPGKQIKPEERNGKEQKKRKRHLLQVTLIPAQTRKLE